MTIVQKEEKKLLIGCVYNKDHMVFVYVYGCVINKLKDVKIIKGVLRCSSSYFFNFYIWILMHSLELLEIKVFTIFINFKDWKTGKVLFYN